jgi:hypothetical protein
MTLVSVTKDGAIVSDKRLAAFYSIISGVSLILTFIVFIYYNAVPGVYENPIRTYVEVTVVICTGIFLIIGGIALIRDWKSGYQLYLLSIGMLSFYLLHSIGYFFQSGDAVLIILIITFVFINLSIIVMSVKTWLKY